MIADLRFNTRSAPEVTGVHVNVEYADVAYVSDGAPARQVGLVFIQSTFGKQLQVRMSVAEAQKLYEDLGKALNKAPWQEPATPTTKLT